MTSPDLTGFWSMTLAKNEWGWNEDRGPGSMLFSFFAEATGTPNQYEGTSVSPAGNTFVVTLVADGNRISWMDTSAGIYQAKGTGTFVEGDVSHSVLGTFAGKSLDPTDPGGRHLGKCFASFTPLPVNELVLVRPRPLFFPGTVLRFP